MNVCVTVGMSEWPFDRLIRAIGPLCDHYRVFAQIGPSRITPPCEHARFVRHDDLMNRLAEADVVVTHAGNTVRLVQRLGKVPIAVAREARWREMPNDHQVEYLRHEERSGRVVAVWDVATLGEAVEHYETTAPHLLAERTLRAPADVAVVGRVLDDVLDRLLSNPFIDHPIRRYAFAWDRLWGRAGRHLDLGIGSGEFLARLAKTTALECFGADAHAGYIEQFRNDHPAIPVRHTRAGDALPFPSEHFESVSLFDVLEHVPDEEATLAEVHRVLAPRGILVLTVPGRHAFSFLDPDNFKFHSPVFHRLVYSARFGRQAYHERFVDLSNGLRGDMSVARKRHTNYARADLHALLERSGFRVVTSTGANFLWRWFQIPGLLAFGRVQDLMNRAILADGRMFSSANVFIVAERFA